MLVVVRGTCVVRWQPTTAIIERPIGYIVVRHFAPIAAVTVGCAAYPKAR
jgi:hypothetical protein